MLFQALLKTALATPSPILDSYEPILPISFLFHSPPIYYGNLALVFSTLLPLLNNLIHSYWVSFASLLTFSQVPNLLIPHLEYLLMCLLLTGKEKITTGTHDLYKLAPRLMSSLFLSTQPHQIECGFPNMPYYSFLHHWVCIYFFICVECYPLIIFILWNPPVLFTVQLFLPLCSPSISVLYCLMLV